MVAAEFKSLVSTIRIHDEYCEVLTDHCISNLSRIISESYKRRQLSGGIEEIAADVAAANMTANMLES